MPYIGTSPSNGVRRVHTYTATASQDTFTGASSEGVTLSYVDTNYIDVFQNGVLLGSADYTSTSGTSVVLAQGASADDLIVIVVYDVFSVADTVSKTNGGSFDSGVTFDSNTTFSAGLDVVNASDSTQMVVRGRSSDNFGIITFKNNAGDTIKGQVKSDASSNLILRAGANNDALKIDTNGHITKPLQPAFQARPTSTITNIATETVIAMANEIFDQNSDYNTSTYTFTAPVTGKYQFSVAVRIDSVDHDSNWQRITLDTSNHSYANSIIDLDGLSKDPVHWNIAYSILADMDAGDTASIKWWQSGGSTQADISTSSYFSGYLVC